MYCANDECILRAIRSLQWDKNRISPSALTDSELSVSRLSVYTSKQILSIYHRDFDPTPNPYSVSLELNVGEIHSTSAAHIANMPRKDRAGKQPLKILNDPLPENKAHAIADGKVTRGLANQLLSIGTVRKETLFEILLYKVLRFFGLSNLPNRILVQDS